MGAEGPTFLAITSDTTCECLKGKAVEDRGATFCRRLRTKRPQREDFFSWWEEGRRPNTPATANRYCKDVCGYKGVSVHLFTSRDELKEHFNTTLKFSPQAFKGTPYYCRIRLVSGAGKVIYSPTSKDDRHCDVYKADSFTMRDVAIIEVEEIGKCLR